MLRHGPIDVARVLAVCAMWIAGIVGATVLDPAPASAHGIHRAERQVYLGPAGPFDVRVRASSAVGDVHVTVFVSETGRGAQIPDAAVLVSLRGDQAGLVDIGPETAEPIIPGSNGYLAVLTVEEPGSRVLMGLITSGSIAGSGTFEVPVPITRPGSEVNWGLIAVLAGLLGFAALPLRRKVGNSGGGPDNGREQAVGEENGS